VNKCATAARVGAGGNQGTGERLVREINAVAIKDFLLEIGHNEQRNIFCLDENQVVGVCSVFLV
jgi:hypothetical protein